MAATTLSESSEQELIKIFKVVSLKVVNSIDGLVKTTQPKLNTLIADTIDAFRAHPQDVHNVMNKLMARMQKLGVTVEELTQGMDKVPKSMQSLQDALRTRETKQIKAEKQVAQLREKGVAARVRLDKEGATAQIISKKEFIQIEEKWAKEEKALQKENAKFIEDTKKFQKQDVSKKKGGDTLEKFKLKEEALVDKKVELAEREQKIIDEKEQYKGKTNDGPYGEGGQADLIDPRGAFAGISDAFAGFKDSVIAPFVQLGQIGMSLGRSFKNFGKAIRTPIKSLKAFGAAMLISLLPMLGWALLIVALIVIIALIVFKFRAIAKAIGEFFSNLGVLFGKMFDRWKEIWGNIFEWIKNIPTMLGEALDKSLTYIGDMGTMIWDGLKSAISTAKDFIVDGFRNVMNGVIGMVNKWLPKKWEIPLIEGKSAAEAEQNKETADTSGVVSKIVKNDSRGVKWNKMKGNYDSKADKELMKTQVTAPDGTSGAAVIIQDNKTVTNTQANSGTTYHTKANNNPEPASIYERYALGS